MSSPIRATNRDLGKRQQSDFEDAVLAALETRGVPLQRHVPLGRWTFDARITGTRLLVECDGSFWHQLPDRVERDRRKDAWAADRAWQVLRVAETAWLEDAERAVAPVLAAWAAVGGTPREAPASRAPPPIPDLPAADPAGPRFVFRASLPITGSVLRLLGGGRVLLTLEAPKSDRRTALIVGTLVQRHFRVTIGVDPLPPGVEPFVFGARLPRSGSVGRAFGDETARLTLLADADDTAVATAVAELTNCPLRIVIEVLGDADARVARPRGATLRNQARQRRRSSGAGV